MCLDCGYNNFLTFSCKSLFGIGFKNLFWTVSGLFPSLVYFLRAVILTLSGPNHLYRKCRRTSDDGSCTEIDVCTYLFFPRYNSCVRANLS